MLLRTSLKVEVLPVHKRCKALTKQPFLISKIELPSL